MIAYILLFGSPPFNGKNENAIFKKIKEGKFVFKDTPGHHVSKEAKAFISRMLISDYKNRPSAEELLNDPWLKTEVSDKNIGVGVI